MVKAFICSILVMLSLLGIPTLFFIANTGGDGVFWGFMLGVVLSLAIIDWMYGDD